MQEVIDEYFKDWVSSTGLGRLDPSDSITVGDFETVKNENGILFLAYFLMACELSGHSVQPYRDRIDHTLETLESAPGLYCRQPKHTTRTEAHDNYVGILALCKMFGFDEKIKRIVDHGLHSGFNYNNVSPSEWELKQQRQGIDVSLYLKAGSYEPTPWDWGWMFTGILLKTDPGKALLNWARFYVLSKCEITSWQKDSFDLLKRDWESTNVAAYIKAYFGHSEHPIHKIAALL